MSKDISNKDSARNSKGQFVKGQSGNPAGRGVGVRAKTTQVKEFIENALTNQLQHDAMAILETAVTMAKAGDGPMIKLLIGDLLSEVRREAKGVTQANIQVIVNNLTDVPDPVVTINQPQDEKDDK